VNNVHSWTTSQWEADIALAQQAHIDGFALNMAAGEGDAAQVANAFSAAQSLGFKLMFSFDYAGNGPWAESDVISLIQQYSSSSAYYHYNNKPLVSTFEGPGQAGDWTNIKSVTGCFFMPDWSSLGANSAMQLGVADGLFSWAAWPWGNTDMNTYIDASYHQYLNGAPYMMGVSPWFYTNLPGFEKNWLWRGDDLWFDRWMQVLWFQPDLVEIITWNDYGESHYIGPLHEEQFDSVFGSNAGQAFYNFADGMPHDAWRQTLPWFIDLYKHGVATLTQEVLTVWYRTYPVSSGACGDSLTTANTHSQLQYEFYPEAVAQDKVFFSILAASTPSVSVTIGGVSVTPSWSHEPYGGVGVYHGSAPFSGHTGAVVVTASTSHSSMSVSGAAISTSCEDGIANWNAWTGYANGNNPGNVQNAMSIYEMACISGTAPGNFAGLCSFACSLGYCPITACQCLELGYPPTVPSPTAAVGYPVSGEDATYEGLCAFNCQHGYCPPSACGPTPVPLATPTVSPFNPDACTSGSNKPGFESFSGLCSYACNFGYCPINICICNSEGPLNQPPPVTDPNPGYPIDGSVDEGLCNFAVGSESIFFITLIDASHSVREGIAHQGAATIQLSKAVNQKSHIRLTFQQKQ
jgi:hypothetical protein